MATLFAAGLLKIEAREAGQRVKLSIAMCTYNGALYVQEQLNSIARQTRLPDELIICDDRSGDDTVAIVKAFRSSAAFPVRLFINEENLGSTRNFEKAISLSSGDIIALSDQDDVWHPEKLEHIENKFLSAPNAGIVFTNGEVVDEELNPLGYSLWDCLQFTNARRKLIEEGRPLEVLTVNNVVVGATMAFRSEYKRLVLPIPADNGLLHDGWIALGIAVVADLVFIPDLLIKYRRHEKQQVGVGRFNLVELMYRARNTDPANHMAIANHFRQAYERLSATGNCHRKEAISHLEAKIAHSYVRGSLPRQRLNRVPYVLKEILTLRYHRYSRGVLSAAKDLFF